MSIQKGAASEESHFVFICTSTEVVNSLNTFYAGYGIHKYGLMVSETLTIVSNQHEVYKGKLTTVTSFEKLTFRA